MSAPPAQPLPRQEAQFPPLRYAQFVVVVLTLVYTASFLDRQIIALTAERVRADLALSDVQLGLLQGLSFAIFYTALGIPMGMLADRTSRRRLILCGLILWSIATALCGFASTFSELFVARMLVGVGEAALAPAAYSLISDYFPRRSRGRAMSVYASGVLIGSGLAYLAGGMILPLADRVAEWLQGLGWQRNGWQIAFILAAAPGAVLPFFLLAVREPARQERSGKPLRPGGSWQFIVERWRYFATLYSALSLMAAVNYGNFAWLPSVFQRIHGRSASDFGYGFGLILLVMGPLGMLTGGALADRMQARGSRSPVLAICGIALILSMPAAALSPMVADVRIAWALIAWQIFTVSVPISLGPVALQLAAPNEFRGFVMALYMVSISMVGLGLGPLVPAILSDHLFEDAGMIGTALALQCALLLPVSALALLRLARTGVPAHP